MKFCEKCGNLIISRNGTLICRECGVKAKNFVLSEKKESKEKDRIVMIKPGKEQLHPQTDEECPKCKNKKAFYWFVQTRAADEAPTKFFKCTKCSHTWRDYD